MKTVSLVRRRLRRVRRIVRAHVEHVGGPFRALKALVFLGPRLGRLDRVIAFLPTKPGPEYRVGEVCALLGYRTTTSTQEPCDLVFKWIDDTYPTTPPEVLALASSRRVMNVRLGDISKSYLGQVMLDVFGYSASVDPTSYVGKVSRSPT